MKVKMQRNFMRRDEALIECLEKVIKIKPTKKHKAN